VNASRQTAWRHVVQALGDGPMTIGEIARRSGWSAAHVKRCIGSLRDAGYVEMRRRPWELRRVEYFLTGATLPDGFCVKDDVRLSSMQRVRAALSDEPASVLDLAIRTRQKSETVRMALRNLERDGQAVRVGSAGKRRLWRSSCGASVSTAKAVPDRSATPRIPPSVTLDAIGAFLGDTPLRPLDVAVAARTDADTARRALRALEARGRAVRCGTGPAGATLWRAASPAR
jgi:DNA-binding MarR family transcriptional regulator